MNHAFSLLAAALVLAALPSIAAQRESVSSIRAPATAARAPDAITPARIELGRMLFFDPRLSGSAWTSCATCHDPAMGWGDGARARMGHEAGLEPAQIAKRLQGIKGYLPLFARAYPGEGVSESTVTRAIATFERTLVSREAPFDRWRKGDRRAVSQAARRGFELFRGKANCVACHDGRNFTDEGFHNVAVRGQESGAHKTPALRDVARNGPYMHNGAYATLREVVEMYSRGGDGAAIVDPNIRKLDLGPGEIDDIVAFLESLTADELRVAAPQLPY